MLVLVANAEIQGHKFHIHFQLHVQEHCVFAALTPERAGKSQENREEKKQIETKPFIERGAHHTGLQTFASDSGRIRRRNDLKGNPQGRQGQGRCHGIESKEMC